MKTVISCSRRTDIPAFHYDWLQKVLLDKNVAITNPYNNAVSEIKLGVPDVHSIVLWSKNFANVLKNPGRLNYYPTYYQFTITGYNSRFEANVIDTDEAVRQLKALASLQSPEQINWRFDPIILSKEGEKVPTDPPGKARLEMFRTLCEKIAPSGVKRCTISFLSEYGAVKQRMQPVNYYRLNEDLQIRFTKKLVEIASEYDIHIYTCASPIIENVPGVLKSSCIDGEVLTRLFGEISGKASQAKDNGQRKECGCTASKDIGNYAMKCPHNCLYCYAQN